MKAHYPSLRFQTQMPRHWLVVLVPLVALSAGCAFILPVPTAYHPAGSRRNLTEATVARFVPGTTTVDDVVLALGEPDQAAADPSRLNYRWERVNMHLSRGWAVAIGPVLVGGEGRETTYSHAYSLSFTFDPSGVLQNVATTNVAVRTTTDTR